MFKVKDLADSVSEESLFHTTSSMPSHRKTRQFLGSYDFIRALIPCQRAEATPPHHCLEALNSNIMAVGAGLHHTNFGETQY